MRRRTFLKGAGLLGAATYSFGVSYLILEDEFDDEPATYEERLEQVDSDEFLDQLGAEEGDERYDELYDVYRDGEIDQRDLGLYEIIKEEEGNVKEGWALQVHRRSVAQYEDEQ
ncbi:MAG: twin-arginine translocation signal domain-containing protein [Candidatus Nanohaloarchaea archaeon]|nr:twin-arginine translocation signal domain-containing protein [Candidatus Nanohaloarchaea archaeon]